MASTIKIVQVQHSDQTCNRCGKSIVFGELADEMLVGRITNAGYQVAVEEGMLEYDPAYYHHECWAETFEEVKDLNPKPTADVTDDAFMVCAACGGGIAFNEPVGRYRLGVLARSMFRPNNEDAEDFVPQDGHQNIQVLCIHCVQAADIADGNEICEDAANDNK